MDQCHWYQNNCRGELSLAPGVFPPWDAKPKEEGNPMGSADEYRRHAAECVRLAQQIANTRDKSLLLAMAQMWIRLAQQAHHRQKEPSEV